MSDNQTMFIALKPDSEYDLDSTNTVCSITTVPSLESSVDQDAGASSSHPAARPAAVLLMSDGHSVYAISK